MKKILVPTDFSACANAAAVTAIKLAQQLKAEVYYLNLCPEPVTVVHVPGVHHELPSDEVKFAKNELAQLVSMTELQGVKATPVLVFDNGIEKIENYVEPYNIDLIVMGSHGASGIKAFVLGSNTQRLVKHVHIPVFVVKDSTGLTGINSLLFVSDFYNVPLKEFEVVARLAHAFKAMVHIVFVNSIDDPTEFTDAQHQMKKLTTYYPEINFSYNVAETNDGAYAIHEFANQLQPDVIAVTISEKNAYSKFVSVRSAEYMVNHEQKPVLVIKG
jgi:nucleotide-binding universal stress UspA family protein